jgi:hypothetical protein
VSLCEIALVSPKMPRRSPPTHIAYNLKATLQGLNLNSPLDPAPAVEAAVTAAPLPPPTLPPSSPSSPPLMTVHSARAEC